jgi:DeoR family transcriptional regulator, fructose operon transcriptional repressor
MSEPLFAEERRREILDQVNRLGRVSVKALSEAMQVSPVTIRQDLRALEENGLLERTYGGAVRRLADSAPPELSFYTRRGKHWQEKDAIAAAAAAMVEDGCTVALDPSTTAYAIVPYLKQRTKITIVTNSLVIAQHFLDTPQIQVIMPGGRLRRESVSIVGRPEGLPEINMNIGFFGARGVSLIGGVSDVDPDQAAMKQAMIARCVTKVVVVDASKWGQIAPYTFIKAQNVDRIITTSDAPSGVVSEFRAQGIQVDKVDVAD